MKYYAYDRVSTPTQVKKGFGLETHENEINKYCDENDIVLSGFFQDEGVSGVTDDETLDLNRPGMIELFNNLNAGDFIIVQNTSRIWRNDTSKVLIRHELKKIKADIISIEQPNYSIYSNDPNDFLINGILELLDQYDKMLIVRKLSNGRKTKANTGTKACGTAPFGYKWNEKKIVIDWNNNIIVQEIFKKYSECKNLSEVQRFTIEKNYKTSTGKDFSKQAISNIIHNDFYIGVVTHAGKKVNGNHEQIIDRDLFFKINPNYDKMLIEI